MGLPAGTFGVASDVLWPVACFGAFFVLPLFLWRFSGSLTGCWWSLIGSRGTLRLTTSQ